MRNNKTQKLLNNTEQYSEHFKNKGVKDIIQYATFDFRNLRNLEEANLDNILHIVQPYEKLYMISQKYYSSPEYGWLICYTNKIGNELNIYIGMPLIIYFPLDRLLGLM